MEPNTVAIPSAPPKRNYLPIALAAGGIVLLLAGIVAGAFLINLTKKDAPSNQATSSSSSSTTSAVAATKRVAYRIGANIWIANSDGTNKIQVTTDGKAGADEVPYYTDVIWHGSKLLTYVKCSANCNIYNYDLETKKEVLIAEPKALIVHAMAWSSDYNTLAYFYTAFTGSKRNLDYKFGDTTTNLLSYSESNLGRDGSLNDGFSLQFTPDDKTVVMMNTALNDPLDKDEASIVVVSLVNKAVKQFPGFNNFPMVSGNNLYYKNAETATLVQYSLGDGTQKEVAAEFFGYHLDLDHSGKMIAYFDYDDSDGKVFLRLLAVGSTSPQQQAENIAYPEWINDKEIIANSTVAAPDDAFWKFRISGLVKFNTETKATTVIENSEVFDFAVEP
jgi:hypothetical protein